jgi:hypothetical protein
MQQVVLPHFRLNVPKQQIVTTTSTPMVALNALVDPIKGKPDNIFIQALSTNTAPIIISPANPAVAGGAGIELPAGGNVSLPSLNPADWYVISSANGQKLNVTYQAGIV